MFIICSEVMGADINTISGRTYRRISSYMWSEYETWLQSTTSRSTEL